MPLTDLAIRNAKPKEKPYKITHGQGMYLLVNRTGKYFRLDYRFNGKRKTIALGIYLYTTLAKANELLLEAKTHLANGIDPSELRKLKKKEGERTSGEHLRASRFAVYCPNGQYHMVAQP